MESDSRVGMSITANNGQKMTIIEYRKHNDIDVEFEDGGVAKHKRFSEFKEGSIKNPYLPVIYGFGFIGEGMYKPTFGGTTTKEYRAWSGMIRRCFDYENMNKRNMVYEDCSICEEWRNFQVFAKWYNENIWCGEKLQVDKDILFKHNKLYSPETCVLTTSKINKLFVKCDKSRGKYPIGMSKKNNKLQVACQLGKESKTYLGVYSTIEEAFGVYKQAKETYIKQMANEYKLTHLNFPQNLYEAMMNYRVEITD
ncbi:MAG: hypothetical protein ACRDD8_01210 [Bacteroidales bacterium]